MSGEQTNPVDGVSDTRSDAYADRLQAKQRVWWKRLLRVQAPYQWNIRRQRLGRTLDVGCGIGRNLANLAPGSIGVDHNAAAIRLAEQSGRTALTVPEWAARAESERGSFDGMLLAHVVEHMTAEEAADLLATYLPALRPGGRVFFVCPQERGYASDPTHVSFTDGDDLTRLAVAAGLQPQRWFSFPFPRWAGKAFIYNEFCLVATKPSIR